MLEGEGEAQRLVELAEANVVVERLHLREPLGGYARLLSRVLLGHVLPDDDLAVRAARYEARVLVGFDTDARAARHRLFAALLEAIECSLSRRQSSDRPDLVAVAFDRLLARAALHVPRL